ncbi:MAG TPA: four helix bundle protein [Ignavibacteriaceae bacterium]|nr:four helix bundle protein [Ignavibacteriaceae bacterium]
MIDLNERLFKFSVDAILFLIKIKNIPEYSIIKYQLTKASTSSCANYEEAQAASSKADFLNKVRIALREMRESNYWMRVINCIRIGDFIEGIRLQNESEELKKILGSIASKVAKELGD